MRQIVLSRTNRVREIILYGGIWSSVFFFASGMVGMLVSVRKNCRKRCYILRIYLVEAA